MSESTKDQPQTLEGGTYEIIRGRLQTFEEDLRGRLGKLNTDRQAVFGAVEAQLLSTERITTAHNCTPRDMVSVGGGNFLFGYNVQFGLKSTTELSDVFSLYTYDGENHTFVPAEFSCEGFEQFSEDFHYVYKYYRNTVFVKFYVLGPHLYIAFRTGKAVEDIKTFKFLMPGDGTLKYIGNRFDHEYQFPPQQEFEWKRAHRDMHRSGNHPHISIDDRVFVETVGGDLTVKVEDNTASGEGIYAEPVDSPDQTLDDAEVLYAIVGSLILLKICPYQEDDFRYLVYNEKTRTVTRIDSIKDSCVLLPDDHGLIFSNGFLLQSGETKLFESELQDMLFESRIPSSNGEDTLFVFYNRTCGTYVLLAYNLIAQEVDTPVVCHGFSLFPDGRLLVFRTDEQPQKHHAVQIWQTPFTGEGAVTTKDAGSFLFKIGNAEIVRCMAECQEVLNLLRKDDTYADLYVDLVKKTGDINDSYFWIGKDEAHRVDEPLASINGAAQSAIAEFEKVQRLRKSTADQTRDVRTKAERLVSAATHQAPDDILGYVNHLADLRSVRGEVIGLRALRYVDGALVDRLESEITDATGQASQGCVRFLLGEQALDPYRAKVQEQRVAVGGLEKVTEAQAVEEGLEEAGSQLEMLIDIVSNLKIDDATEATKIIDDVSTIYGTLNQVRSEVRKRKSELARAEGEGQFNAQMKLIAQSVVNYLDVCDSPEKCDEFLTKLMVQVEELEGKFGEFDDYVAQLVEKRDEIYSAFETKKQQLLEARNKRAGTLMKSAERILGGIQRRIEGLKEITEINGYFAGDLMIEKVRDIVSQLTGLGDPVKADDIQTQLKTIREDAVRQLKDRRELFVDGQNVIRFGNHQFSVNTRELDLTVVPRDDEMCFHLAGTAFYEPVRDEMFLSTRDVWNQEVVSENDGVYRAEYLAYQLLRSLEEQPEGGGLVVPSVEDIQAFMGSRYAEAYMKGVHDSDAHKILAALLPVHESAGLLRFSAGARALGLVFWEWYSGAEKEALASKLESFGRMRQAFGAGGDKGRYVDQIGEGLRQFVKHTGLFDVSLVREAAGYLVEEIASGSGAVVSSPAAHLVKHLHGTLSAKRVKEGYGEALAALADDVVSRFEVIRDWVAGCAALEEGGGDPSAISEAAAHELRGGFEQRSVLDVATKVELDGMLGDHPAVVKGGYQLDYNTFLSRLRRYRSEVVPRFESYHELRAKLVEEKREQMRLDEFKPHVMSAFVRNKLLDQVYLPLIGDNLAKQIGTVGADTRTDRMGLLLLISPPGYGKTTLMEYVANRLGITFMKINGPAIGHHVTSLDPEEAPNASAREEVNKLNLALEMGDNVMIYLDDIQHCNPEFLQKFISLCDGQRKIEGVWDGKARTYDLRGKKVAVVMAGNPYTESGGKFQIPDMLANRADTYNLGDIIGENDGAFKDSYIENALTSNPVLGKLSGRSQKDVYAVMRIAETGSQEGVDFEENYAIEEIGEFVSVTKKLMRVRDTILRVNLEYIRSAAMEDAYRNEPPFKLQGSYRNMNRIAEKILPIMTDEEVEGVIVDHYGNESQTLTTGAEANLLKFRELEGMLDEEGAARWAEIRKGFQKQKLLGAGGEDDPVARVVAQLSAFQDGLDRIGGTLASAFTHQKQPATLADQTVDKIETMIAGLRAVPVEVEIKVVPVQEEPGGTTPKKKAKVIRDPAVGDLPVDIEGEFRQGE